MPLDGVIVIDPVKAVLSKINNLALRVDQNPSALVFTTFAAELATPAVGPCIGERDLGGINSILCSLFFACSLQISRELPVDLGVAAWVGFMPVACFALLVVDVMEGPEGRDGAEFRCNLCPNGVSARGEVLSCGDGASDASRTAVVLNVAIVEVAIGLQSQCLDGQAVVQIIDYGHVQGTDTTIVTSPGLG